MNEKYSRVKLAIAEGCNLNCKHCYMGEKRPFFINPTKAKSIIAESKDLGVSTLDITGGEPLMHPEFEDIIRFAGQKMFKNINISTNALFLNHPNIANAVKDHNAHCNISLDGATEKTTDAIRGKNSFAKIMTILEMLDSQGVSYSLRFSINSLNKGEVAEMIDLGASLNVKIDISPTQLAGNASRNLVLSNQDITDIKNVIKQKTADNPDQQIEEGFVEGEVCDGGDPGIISVNIDGKAVSCFMMNIIHDFQGATLKKMWDAMQIEKERLRNFRPQLAQCLNCETRGICESGCNITAIHKNCIKF